MKRLTIAALVAAATASAALVASAQLADARPSWWPALGRAMPAVSEWYSDIPWHQKLGTYAGNEIDEVLVLPYAALPVAERLLCTSNRWTQQQCMLELGVNNILGMKRTDTPYSPEDPRIKEECKDLSLPCIEVKLELSSFWSRAVNGRPAVVARPFGQEPGTDGYYRGYTITDGSTYAPLMPWYMAHYCDSQFVTGALDVQDPVCYGDYFSPMNNGFNPIGKGLTDWPKSVPWSIYPSATSGPTNHCKDGLAGGTTPGLGVCTMVLGGFKLEPVPSNPANFKPEYKKYNEFLLAWFNNALQSFPTDLGAAEVQRHFPWNGQPVTWETFLYPQAVSNPFLGQFEATQIAPANGATCDVTLTGPNGPNCYNTAIIRAKEFTYPRQCTLADLNQGNVERLRKCGLNYELHHNGYLSQWPESFWPDVRAAGMIANQYGRTSFVFAGVPGMQMPVSFAPPPGSDQGTLSIYEQVHNASIFSLYLPVANISDTKRAFTGRNYTDPEFYHTLLMSNHMESDPDQFAEGIRGKALWHNEYRTQKMYEAFRNNITQKFPSENFAGGFTPQPTSAPYHNNTCDGCHVRNGSGVPINTVGKLDVALQEFMKDQTYNPYVPVKDYTFTGEIRPMKLVFFDLRRNLAGADSSVFSEPLAQPKGNPAKLYYNNKIMNFYGDSFHVTTPGYSYSWSYEAVNANRLVVSTPRVNAELAKTYTLRQIKLGAFQTSPTCSLVAAPRIVNPWPRTCEEVNGAAITQAVTGGDVGYMLLNGKRLGNLAAIEAIPNQAILGFAASQKNLLGDDIAGEIIWNAGSRDGVMGGNSKVFKECKTKSLTDCFIGRFGFLGDRVSLQDQVANAAFVEMNLLTTEGYNKLYPNGNEITPIRYGFPNCGPANKACIESTGNGTLSEKDVDRMADYARWLGNPTRSELEVALPETIAGEKVFREVKCDTCHVIRKIEIDPQDTMLDANFRDRLAKRVAPSGKPFLSYIGTDLLMHDMGYLSQLAPANQSIRNEDGTVKPQFRTYVQKIRTPALKGLRLNRYVTDSHKNTKTPLDPACDFLLHDGRACDAIEAAFLHDGPAIKKLGVIEALNGLGATKTMQLRAFLYSL